MLTFVTHRQSLEQDLLQSFREPIVFLSLHSRHCFDVVYRVGYRIYKAELIKQQAHPTMGCMRPKFQSPFKTLQQQDGYIVSVGLCTNCTKTNNNQLVKKHISNLSINQRHPDFREFRKKMTDNWKADNERLYIHKVKEARSFSTHNH